jgi:hypothetical protein
MLAASCSSPRFKIIERNDRTLRDYVMIYAADPKDDFFVVLIDRNTSHGLIDTTRCELIHKDRFYCFDMISLPDTVKLAISDSEVAHFRGHVLDEDNRETGFQLLFEFNGKLIHVYNGYDKLMIKGYLCTSLIYKDGLIYRCKNVNANH